MAAEEFLTNATILMALFVSILLGFGFTFFLLYLNDARVFDLQGKYIPGPISNLWGKNFNNVISHALQNKQMSKSICDNLLNELGDGNIFACNSIFGTHTVVIGHPDMVKAVLSGHHEKFAKINSWSRLKLFLGEGLLTSSSGARWYAHRQMIQPTFSQPDALQGMILNFNEQSYQIMNHWRKNIRRIQRLQPNILQTNIRLDLKQDLLNLSMSILCYNSFGYNFQYCSDRKIMSKAFDVISEELKDRVADCTGLSCCWYGYNNDYVHIDNNMTMSRWLAYYHSFVASIIKYCNIGGISVFSDHNSYNSNNNSHSYECCKNISDNNAPEAVKSALHYFRPLLDDIIAKRLMLYTKKLVKQQNRDKFSSLRRLSVNENQYRHYNSSSSDNIAREQEDSSVIVSINSSSSTEEEEEESFDSMHNNNTAINHNSHSNYVENRCSNTEANINNIQSVSAVSYTFPLSSNYIYDIINAVTNNLTTIQTIIQFWVYSVGNVHKNRSYTDASLPNSVIYPTTTTPDSVLTNNVRTTLATVFKSASASSTIVNHTKHVLPVSINDVSDCRDFKRHCDSSSTDIAKNTYISSYNSNDNKIDWSTTMPTTEESDDNHFKYYRNGDNIISSSHNTPTKSNQTSNTSYNNNSNNKIVNIANKRYCHKRKLGDVNHIVDKHKDLLDMLIECGEQGNNFVYKNSHNNIVNIDKNSIVYNAQDSSNNNVSKQNINSLSIGRYGKDAVSNRSSNGSSLNNNNKYNNSGDVDSSRNSYNINNNNSTINNNSSNSNTLNNASNHLHSNNRNINNKYIHQFSHRSSNDINSNHYSDVSNNNHSNNLNSHKFSRSELRDHIMTFLTAGQESTAAALLWTIYELCRHPAIQIQCQEELDRIRRNKMNNPLDDANTLKGNKNTLDNKNIQRVMFLEKDISKLDILLQVLKESMRLHPVTGTLAARCCTSDVRLGDYHIKAGTRVIVSVYAVHRHIDYWEAPESFKPERFSHDCIHDTIKHPYQYIPFSAGPRSCIGQRFALMQVLVILAQFLTNFSFSLAAKDVTAEAQEEETLAIQPKEFNVIISLR